MPVVGLEKPIKKKIASNQNDEVPPYNHSRHEDRFSSSVSVVFEKVLGLKYYITMPLSFISGVLGPVIVIFLVDLLEKKIY